MDTSPVDSSITEPNTTTTSNTITSQDASSSSQSNQILPDMECTNCHKTPETLKPCIKCHSVSYCSRDCQKADMKKHKKNCAAAAQIYAQTADFKPQVTRMAPDEGRRRGLQKWQFDT